MPVLPNHHLPLVNTNRRIDDRDNNESRQLRKPVEVIPGMGITKARQELRAAGCIALTRDGFVFELPAVTP